MVAFMVALFATATLRPSATLFLWVIFLPIWTASLWRLRCWNCGDRLLRDGGSHLELYKIGIVRWDICRHKTCGAELR